MQPITQQEYRNLKAAVTRYITKNGGTVTDSEDFLNDTLLRFYANELKYQTGNFGGFICTVVQRRWIDHQRQRKTKPTLVLEKSVLENQTKISESMDYEDNIDYDNFLRDADWNNQQTAVIDALWKNPALIQRHQAYRNWDNTECKQRLERSILEGLSNRAIADLEAVKEMTLNQRLKRCRDSFKAAFQKLCVVSKKA